MEAGNGITNNLIFDTNLFSEEDNEKDFSLFSDSFLEDDFTEDELSTDIDEELEQKQEAIKQLRELGYKIDDDITIDEIELILKYEITCLEESPVVALNETIIREQNIFKSQVHMAKTSEENSKAGSSASFTIQKDASESYDTMYSYLSDKVAQKLTDDEIIIDCINRFKNSVAFGGNLERLQRIVASTFKSVKAQYTTLYTNFTKSEAIKDRIEFNTLNESKKYFQLFDELPSIKQFKDFGNSMQCTCTRCKNQIVVTKSPFVEILFSRSVILPQPIICNKCGAHLHISRVLMDRLAETISEKASNTTKGSSKLQYPIFHEYGLDLIRSESMLYTHENSKLTSWDIKYVNLEKEANEFYSQFENNQNIVESYNIDNMLSYLEDFCNIDVVSLLIKNTLGCLSLLSLCDEVVAFAGGGRITLRNEVKLLENMDVVREHTSNKSFERVVDRLRGKRDTLSLEELRDSAIEELRVYDTQYNNFLLELSESWEFAANITPTNSLSLSKAADSFDLHGIKYIIECAKKATILQSCERFFEVTIRNFNNFIDFSDISDLFNKLKVPKTQIPYYKSVESSFTNIYTDISKISGDNFNEQVLDIYKDKVDISLNYKKCKYPIPYYLAKKIQSGTKFANSVLFAAMIYYTKNMNHTSEIDYSNKVVESLGFNDILEYANFANSNFYSDFKVIQPMLLKLVSNVNLVWSSKYSNSVIMNNAVKYVKNPALLELLEYEDEKFLVDEILWYTGIEVSL